MKIDGMKITIPIGLIQRLWKRVFGKKTVEAPTLRNPASGFQYPIQVNETFPWKGLWFRVIDVNDYGFVAKLEGFTKNASAWKRER